MSTGGGTGGKLRAMVLGTLALDYTLALIAIFGGIGVVAMALIVYIAVQARSEKRADEEWHERGYQDA